MGIFTFTLPNFHSNANSNKIRNSDDKCWSSAYYVPDEVPYHVLVGQEVFARHCARCCSEAERTVCALSHVTQQPSKAACVIIAYRWETQSWKQHRVQNWVWTQVSLTPLWRGSFTAFQVLALAFWPSKSRSCLSDVPIESIYWRVSTCWALCWLLHVHRTIYDPFLLCEVGRDIKYRWGNWSIGIFLSGGSKGWIWTCLSWTLTTIFIWINWA